MDKYLKFTGYNAILNIGMMRGTDASAPMLTTEEIRKAMAKHNAFFENYVVTKSGTEDTMIVRILAPMMENELHALAETLDQQAIVQIDKDKGILAGPKAKEWGEFDESLFLLFGGKTLEESLAQPN